MTGEEAWYTEVLPEALHDLPIVKESADQETFTKRLGDQQDYVSQALRVPGEDAGEEDWKAFDEKLTSKVPHLMRTPNLDDDDSIVSTLRTLGAPEEAAGYKQPTLEVDEGMEQNTAIVDTFRAAAHKHNLTQKQFEGVLNDIHGNSVENERTRILNFKEDRGKLVTKWGATHDGNLDAITVFMAKTDAPPALKDITKFGDAATLDWLNRLTKAVKGESVNAADDTNGEHSAAMTPNEAQAKISEIRGNPKHPYNNPQDPGHKAAKARMRQLYVYKDPANAEKPATR